MVLTNPVADGGFRRQEVGALTKTGLLNRAVSTMLPFISQVKGHKN